MKNRASFANRGARTALGGMLAAAMAVLGACSGDIIQAASMIQGIQPPAPPPPRRSVPRAPAAPAAILTPPPMIMTPPPVIATPPPVAMTPAVPTPTPTKPVLDSTRTPHADVPRLSRGRPPAPRPDVTFVIRLVSLDDMSSLDERPGVSQVVDAARRYPESQIFLAAYVTEEDTRSRHAAASDLADEIVIRLARYLADRGVDPQRITGKGAGIDNAVGRAIVVSIDVGASAAVTKTSTVRKGFDGAAVGL